MKHPFHCLRFLLCLSFALTAARAQYGDFTEESSADTVSIEELRNPLKGKPLKLVAQAEKAIRDNDGDGARLILTPLLDDIHVRPYALCLLGGEDLKQVWNDRSFLDPSVRELEECVANLPGAAASQSNLAVALALRGDLKTALAHVEKSRQLNPGEPRSRLVLGWILALAGDDSDAKFHLRLAAQELKAATILLEALYPTPAD